MNWFQRLWFKRVIYPFMMKHKPECMVALRDAFVWQMWAADVKFDHINKWLAYTNQPTIKGYMVKSNNRDIQLFYTAPDDARLKQLPGRYISIA